jgi:hypothetical protein
MSVTRRAALATMVRLDHVHKPDQGIAASRQDERRVEGRSPARAKIVPDHDPFKAMQSLLRA